MDDDYILNTDDLEQTMADLYLEKKDTTKKETNNPIKKKLHQKMLKEIIDDHINKGIPLPEGITLEELCTLADMPVSSIKDEQKAKQNKSI